MAQISVPMLKVVIANAKIGRVFMRCSKKPVIGITTAMVSRNAVVNHCAAPAVTPRSAIRWGMATLMIVSLRMTTKLDTSSSAMTRRLRAASLGLMAAAGANGSRLVASVLIGASLGLGRQRAFTAMTNGDILFRHSRILAAWRAMSAAIS